MRKSIPHSKPSIGPGEISAVVKVLKSGQLAQNGKVALFEKKTAAKLGSPYGVAVNSGTTALTLALRALKAEGGEVIIPSFACSSLYHAVLGAQATPVLADCDPRTFNIDASDTRSRLTRKTRAIVAPHMFGLPCDVKALIATGVPVVEDCAQSLGSSISGKPTGGFGSAAVLSFYATKLLTTGEGGMIICARTSVLEYLKRCRDYDNTLPDMPKGNCKLTDFQAALGLVQLSRLPAFLKERAAIAKHYDQAFKGLPLEIPLQTAGRIYSRYVLRCPKDRLRELLASCEKHGVSARRPVYRPLHLDVPCKGKFPGAQAAWDTALSLPLYPGLTPYSILYITKAVINSL